MAMASFDFFIIPLVLSLLTLLSRTSEADPIYRGHKCFNQTTSTANSTYRYNLNRLLSSLSSNANNESGFYSSTAGQDSDTSIYGLFLCRGDVAADICQDCVATAAKEVVQPLHCPSEKAAVIWYDICMLRYSNGPSLFSTTDDTHRISLGDGYNATDPDRLRRLVETTMNGLLGRAANAPSCAKKFATKEANFTESKTLYSLVQCIPDLSNSGCSACLKGLIENLAVCCGGQLGATILDPNCNVRYETYPFYLEAVVALAPTPPCFTPTAPTPTRRSKGKGLISLLRIVRIVALIAVTLVLFALSYYLLSRSARKKFYPLPDANVADEIVSIESLQFDLATIKAATNQFSDDNKVGRGGFGEVYKATLFNRQEIVVKRFTRNSGQGIEEFKSEVVLIAKLQHRNLVRLLGFCIEEEEKILVYEFVPDKSLDNFLFDSNKQKELDWSRQYNIILGIARGILYLHEDSQLRIIHCDLKASNILLDENMNQKISDFGTARIFGTDQTRDNTNRVVGTYGYMSPEYVIHGQISTKSDVYSFGILILEILSGKKNNSFCSPIVVDNLVTYAWTHWRHGTSLELLDPTLGDSFSRDEVDRCIHIGLLCIQENPTERPTMASICLMLNSYSVTLPSPQRPGFFLRSKTEPNVPIHALESDHSAGEAMASS